MCDHGLLFPAVTQLCVYMCVTINIPPLVVTQLLCDHGYITHIVTQLCVHVTTPPTAMLSPGAAVVSQQGV